MANEFSYPEGPLGPKRLERFHSAPPMALDTRAAVGLSVESQLTAERLKLGYPKDTALAHMAQAQIDRVAISCALVEHG